MRRLRETALRIAPSLMMAVAWPTVGWTNDVPLPKDVKRLSPVVELTLGAQPVQARGLHTALSAADARQFYQAALSKDGWQLDTAPWMAKAKEQMANLARVQQEHPDEWKRLKPDVKQQLDRVDPSVLRTQIERALYGRRGAERILVEVSPDDEGAMVLIYRWDEPAASPRPSVLSQKIADAPEASLIEAPPTALTQPCCSAEPLPTSTTMLSRTLPPSVPVYPGSRALSSLSPSGPLGLASEIYLSADPADQVMAYYRTQMGRAGWVYDPVSERMGQDVRPYLGSQAASAKMQFLTFRKGEAACGVVVGEQLNPTSTPASSEPASSGPASAEPGSTSKEQTLIALTYVTLPSTASRTYRPPTSLDKPQRKR